MSNISRAFDHGKAFIPFITCGDPSLDVTAETVRAMERAGADLIELGIPFSDPTAEGATIMNANLHALAAGTTTDRVFDMVRELRKTVKVPMVFMTYANVLFSYGSEQFIAKSAEIGMDGFIIPDVPFEERDEFLPLCRKYGLDLISMIAPTSDARAETIAREAQGFLYCVSSLGVTGARSTVSTDIAASIARVKKVSAVPCAIGFGISNAEQAAEMARYADGVIIGSAIVSLCEKYGEDAPKYIEEFVRGIKTAISKV